MPGGLEKKRSFSCRTPLFCCWILIAGCASQGKQIAEVKISSMPAGAKISYYYEKSNKKISKGVTPYRSSVRQSGKESVWLVAELSGYETEIYKLEPSQTPLFNHDLILEEDFSMQIRKERGSYSDEYRKSIAGILKTCEEVLTRQGMLASSVITQANREYQNIQSKYPEHKGSALDRAITKLLEKILFVAEVEYTNNRNSHALLKNINALITKIYFGLRSF